MSNEKIIKNSSIWKDKLQILLSKKKTTSTINQPYLSIGFILSLMAIIYVPLVNVFSEKGGYKNLEQDWWRLLLVGFPIVLIIFILFWKFLFQMFLQKSKIKDAAIISLQQTFQVYNNKQEKETKIETISENEPSVQEFRNWMKEIDSDLGDKKLVLVFDNFDRLPKKQIISIWSSLHVFFSEEKYKNIKVIVPFDRAHIKNAFRDMDGSSGDYSNDYINKTFDLVYRVSPPILSSWKLFFKENWKKAFVNFDELEYLKVEQAYEIIQSSITPREIIAFINEVVSLKLLQEEISERYIAIFVLNKDHILENPLSAILDLNYLKSLELYYSEDEDYQKNITAMAYQINPENALEVVYKKKLKDSLMNKDFEEFNKLVKTEVFERIIQSVLNEIEELRNPVIVLNQIKENSAISDTILNHLWNDLYLRLKNYDNKEGKIDEQHKILLEKINRIYKSKWLQKIVNDLNYNNSDIKYFISTIDDLDLFVKEKVLEQDVFQLLSNRKVDVADFITLIEEKGTKYLDYKLYCNIEELDEYLKSLQINDLHKALFIQDLSETESRELYSFKNWLIDLGSHHTNNPINFALILRLLHHVSEDFLPTFLQDSELFTHFKTVSNKSDFYADLLAIKIKIGPINHPNYTSVYDDAFNQIDEKIGMTLISKIGHYMSIDEYLSQTIIFNKETLKFVTRNYLESNFEKSLKDVKTILDSFQSICQTNEIFPEKIFDLIDQFEFDELNFEYVFNLSNYVFEHAINSSSLIANKLLTTIFEHFDNFNSEQWLSVFDDLQCREIELLDLTGYSKWNGFSTEAFKTRLFLMLDGGKIDYPKIISFLIKSFENSGKDLTNMFKDIRDELISKRNINENLFAFLFSWLVKYSDLIEKSEDVLRTIIIPSLLDNSQCLAVLIKESQSIKSLIQSSNKSAFSDFKDGIIARKENHEIDELAKLLLIK